MFDESLPCEITQRINAAYDEIFAMQILDALVPTNKTKLFKQWKNKKWSRDFLTRKYLVKNNSEDSLMKRMRVNLWMMRAQLNHTSWIYLSSKKDCIKQQIVVTLEIGW